MSHLRLVSDQPTPIEVCKVIPLAARRPWAEPAHDLPSPPRLRLAVPGEREGDAFRLETFLARARIVMSEPDAGGEHPALRAIPPAS